METQRKIRKAEIARTRESTAQQVKHYYLQCLHQLVNTRSHDSKSHDPKSHDLGSHPRRKTAGFSSKTHVLQKAPSPPKQPKSQSKKPTASLSQPSTNQILKSSKKLSHDTISPSKAPIVKNTSRSKSTATAVSPRFITTAAKRADKKDQASKTSVSRTVSSDRGRTVSGDVGRHSLRRNLFGTTTTSSSVKPNSH